MAEAPLFLPHKPILCRAYAAQMLVLRLRLRWIIHPGVFGAPKKHILSMAVW